MSAERDMTCPRGCCPNYRTHIQGIRISGFPSPQTLSERKLSLDMGAYKRLVDDGLQPPTIDGAYVMERSAKDEKEIELGRPVDKDTLSILKES